MSFAAVLLEPAALQAALPRWSDGASSIGVDPAATHLALVEWTHDHPTDHLIVLTRAVNARRAREAITLLTAHRPHTAATLIARSTSALHLALAGCRGIREALDPNHAVAQIEYLLDAGTGGAVVRSVASLTEPNPGALRRLGSVWPSTRYLLRFGAQPPVQSARSATEALGQLTHVDERLSDVLTGRAADAARCTPLVDAKAVYGARGAEIATLPPGADHLRPRGRCPVCRYASVGETCPFCQVYVSEVLHS